MAPPENAPRSLNALMDWVLLEMAATHPALTSDQEASMKARLFEITADADGWRRDPREMTRLFRKAIDGL